MDVVYKLLNENIFFAHEYKFAAKKDLRRELLYKKKGAEFCRIPNIFNHESPLIFLILNIVDRILLFIYKTLFVIIFNI